MTSPVPAPTPTPPAPTPAPTPSVPEPTPAPPTYVPPASLTPVQPAPAGPQYVPAVPVPAATPAEADDGTRDVSRLPQWAQGELTKLKDENAKRRISERTAIVSQHAHYAAGQLGANPAALLGSTAFSALAEKLDPHAADFPARLTEAINQTIAANPWMAAAPAAVPAVPAAPPASGAEFAAGSGAGAPITEAQLAQMSKADIAEAYAAGKLAHLL